MTQRQPRLLDPGYLRWLRKQCCAACARRPPCDAAHLRMAWLPLNKPLTGIGRKPDDKWALPLCHSCHMRQHAYGSEHEWWKAQGVENPALLCSVEYRIYGGTGGKPAPRRKIRPRKPRHLRAKITSRNTLKRAKR